MPTPPFRGFFINLDRNQARLQQMNRQLSERGVSHLYTRVPGIDGFALGPEYRTQLDRGNLGLWLTHEKIIEANRTSDAHLHIMEDDALLPNDASTSIPELLRIVDERYPTWDLIFTEIYLQMAVGMFRLIAQGKEAFKKYGRVGLSPLKTIHFAGTSSVLINGRSLDKYLGLMTGNWKQGYPIDLYLRRLVNGGMLNAMATIPFLTTLAPETTTSDIRGDLNASHLVLNIYRRAAFKDADLTALSREIDEFLKGVEIASVAEIYLKVLRYCLSDKHIEI